MDYFEASYHTMFRRCVLCPGSQNPSCPVCTNGDICTLVAVSCDECQKTVCVASPPASTAPPKSSSSGPNVGAIAGGVIGGVAVIAVLTYLVWRFCIKTRRQAFEQENWADEDSTIIPEKEKDFAMRRDARASTHTVGSIASTVLTRASNIIQIAYIPGVTNRSGSTPSTPGLLVPPVPPIPIALSSAASTPRYEQEHFFIPGDLSRDSTWSGTSDRTSYARTSVASTIYGKNAIVSPVPAQTVIRGKAAVVSVKQPNGSSSSGELTPPVPSINFDKYGAAGPPSPAFSVGSTFLNSASAATVTRPQIVRVPSQAKKSPTNLMDDDLDSEQSPLFPHERDSSAITLIDESSPVNSRRPFSDQTERLSLGAVAEESRRKPDHSDIFGDHHEMKE